MADHITPELVETAARARARADGASWEKLPEDNRAAYRDEARVFLRAVAPLIDRAARSDELSKQAANFRGTAKFCADRAAEIPPHARSRAALRVELRTRASALNGVAEQLRNRARTVALPTPTEEN